MHCRRRGRGRGGVGQRVAGLVDGSLIHEPGRRRVRPDDVLFFVDPWLTGATLRLWNACCIETYGQLDLMWGEDGCFDGDYDRSYHGQINGWVGAANLNGVHVNLARRSGGSPGRILLRARGRRQRE